jgi:hypothetical protein
MEGSQSPHLRLSLSSVDASETPLSPFVSTYLQEFGRPEPERDDQLSRRSRHRSRESTRTRQGSGKAPKNDFRSASPSEDSEPEQEVVVNRPALPIGGPANFAVPLSLSAISPFKNDGTPAFSEWVPAVRPERNEELNESVSVARKGLGGAVKAMKDQLRVPSPRMVLPPIRGDEGVGSKPKRTKAVAAPATITQSGRHSAPPGIFEEASSEYVPPSGMGDAYLPIDLWNNVVARNVDMDPPPHFSGSFGGGYSGGFNAMVRPFNRLKVRQYMNSTVKPMMSKIKKEPKDMSPIPKSLRQKPSYAAVFEEGREAASQAVRPEAPPSRLEASLLKEALDTMTNNIKINGKEPRHLARQCAVRGKIEEVSDNLEPELYVLDIIMTELVKQTNTSCKERGSVMETIRHRLLDLFSTATLAISRACSDMDHIAEESETVAASVAPLEQKNEELLGNLQAVESENVNLKFKNGELSETLEMLRRSYEEAQNDEHQGQTLKEQQAMKLMKEANDMRDMLQSKLSILNAQLRQQGMNALQS